MLVAEPNGAYGLRPIGTVHPAGVCRPDSLDRPCQQGPECDHNKRHPYALKDCNHTLTYCFHMPFIACSQTHDVNNAHPKVH